MRKGVANRLKGWLFKAVVRSSMLYAAETWPVRKVETLKLDRTEMRMLRWMNGSNRKDHITNESLRKTFGLEPVAQVLRRNRLRWLGHIVRRNEESVIRKCQQVRIDGDRPRGRPRLTWRALVDVDLKY